MTRYTLSFKPAIGLYGAHDPGAALFADGVLAFGTEEERYTRQKHAIGTFPGNAIKACLDFEDIELADVDTIILPYDPNLVRKRLVTDVKRGLAWNTHPVKKLVGAISQFKDQMGYRYFPDDLVRSHLADFGTPVPEIEHRSHHRCHAASAFHPSDFDDAVVLTLDGRGEYDSTVVWHGTPTGLERVRTYKYRNSLGHFFAAVTEFLGYRAFNGEGKVMGLAPYGEFNEEIANALRSAADFSANYDVTGLLAANSDTGASRLEEVLGRPRSGSADSFDQFDKDLAHTAQALLEEVLCAITRRYVDKLGTGNVGLSGGVALNCKANKRVMELDCVDGLFVQPVAHDAGIALGAGWLDSDPADVEPMTDVYWGPEPAPDEIEALLKTNKIAYDRRGDVEEYVAQRLANGALVGWMQGRQEMGPRALGDRSILADPRTAESRDNVNEYVKHREGWRPFAPSMLEEAVDEYLVEGERAPYMIKTFDTVPEKRDEIEAVIHPADATTRPQTVRENQNPRYYRLISEFEDITGVPVVLNTSFNDHAEPIVTTPVEAIRDFYGMGLDVLVIEDFVVEKPEASYSE